VIGIESPVKLSFLRICQGDGVRHFGNAVPNILNELNPFGDTQTKDICFTYHFSVSSYRINDTLDFSSFQLLRTCGAERRARRLHRRWKAEVTVRSSAWFGANCRLVYFIIDHHRQAPDQVR
jgi:hypothetical protein